MNPRRDTIPLEYAALVPMFGGMEKKPRLIDRDVVTMGRARGSDFCLDGNEVSALHCLIYRAADGYRVRDCGSRTGTRLNGQSVKTALMGNGDVLQIGPFSFEVRIPRTFQAEAAADPHKTERLQRSRRHLARAALRLRRKVRELRARGGAASPAFDRAQADLKAKLKAFDQRVNQLELSEQELLQEREDHDKLRKEFQRQVHLKEAEIAERRKTLEVEFQDRWEAVQKEVASLKRGSHVSAAPVEVQQLQQQRLELESLANRLKKKDDDLSAEAAELQRERDELERTRAEILDQQIAARKLFDSVGLEHRPASATGDADAQLDAQNDLFVQKAQLAAMMEEVKHLQESLLGQSNDVNLDAYEKKVADLTGQLEVANRLDEQQLRQIMSDVQMLQEQNAMLREKASIADRAAAVEAENHELRARLASGAGLGEDVIADFERLRSENKNLLQLADELQKQFGVAGTSLGNDEATAALRRENESLRAHLVAAETETLGGRSAELARENEELRGLLYSAEAKLQKLDESRTLGTPSEAGGTEAGGTDAAGEVDILNNEINLLKELLAEKDVALREVEEAADKSTMSDPESYEAELNRFRKELEADRSKLSAEINSLRIRNQELDDATRDMEMEMSRERAEIARERIRLDRLRDELKIDMEKLQREHETRGTLASVHKLRDDLKAGSAHGGKGAPAAGKGAPAAGKGNPVTDRLRTMRGH